MSDPTTPAIIQPEAPADAYSLLSKPTLDLTDAEVETIVADLRRRRKLFVEQGVKDEPVKKAAAARKALPKEKADKAANTLALLSQLKL